MDLAAWELSDLNGAPEFGLDWATADKDEAIPAISEFLRRMRTKSERFRCSFRT
jgi:hypothetical protein